MPPYKYQIELAPGQPPVEYQDEAGLPPEEVWKRWRASLGPTPDPRDTSGSVGYEIVRPFLDTMKEAGQGLGQVATGGPLEKILGAGRSLASPVTGMVSEPLYRGVKGLTGSSLLGETAGLAGALMAPESLVNAIPNATSRIINQLSRLRQSQKAGGFQGVAGQLLDRFTGHTSVQEGATTLAQADAAAYKAGTEIANPLYEAARKGMSDAPSVTGQRVLDTLKEVSPRSFTPAMQDSTEKLMNRIGDSLIDKDGILIPKKFSAFDDSLKDVTKLISKATDPNDRRILVNLRDAIQDNMSLFKPTAGNEAALKTFNQARQVWRSTVGQVYGRRELLVDLQTNPSTAIDRFKNLTAEEISRDVRKPGLAPYAYNAPDVMTGLPDQVKSKVQQGLLTSFIGEEPLIGKKVIDNIESWAGGSLKSSSAKLKFQAVWGPAGEDVLGVLQHIKDLAVKTRGGNTVETITSGGLSSSPYMGAHMQARGWVGLMGGIGGATAAGGALYGHPLEGIAAGSLLAASPVIISKLLSINGGAKLLKMALDAPLGSNERLVLASRVAALSRALMAQNQ